MQRPDFILIPRSILEDKKINRIDGYLYGYIYWFTRLKNERCIAGNKLLAELVGTTTGVIKNSLKKLEVLQYIRRVYQNNSRGEIIPLVTFGGGSPIGDGGGHLKVTGGSPIGDQNKSIEEEGNPKGLPSAFNFREYLEKMHSHHQRHIQVVAFFFAEKGLAFKTLEQTRAAIKRHVRAARALAVFDDDEVFRAADEAKREYPKLWTLETLLKILTK